MRRTPCLAALALLFLPTASYAQPFVLAPALAIEAEEFVIDSGWKVIRNGAGNYMVDSTGANPISGERLLHAPGNDDTAAAHLDVTIPEAGKYRVWVRYEYPSFCEACFRVQIEQDGQIILSKLMGTKESPRFARGDDRPKAQHDRASGNDGLVEEAVTVPDLKKGKARLILKTETQTQTTGVAAARNIDLLYLTRDLRDEWLAHYRKQQTPYPILDAFRDTRGPRWEARFTNRGDKPTDFSIAHVYNRQPLGEGEGSVARGVKPGESTPWIGLKHQDTAHFGMSTFNAFGGQPFDVALRPVGGAIEREVSGVGPHRLYLPPYPGMGDKPVTPEEQIDAILKELKSKKAPGKVPTKPLCYGGWMPLGVDSAYGRKYAELYAALGFRSLHPGHSGPAMLKNLQAVGIEPTQTWAISSNGNPPLPAAIERAKAELSRSGMTKNLLWFEYGDEVPFSQWMEKLVENAVELGKQAGQPTKGDVIKASMWNAWLATNRADVPRDQYWRDSWGKFNDMKLRPDTSAAAAEENPRLYVDSLIFFEERSIRFVAERAKDVRAAFPGQEIFCGSSYSAQPFNYPTVDATIKWFRGGAADMARHTDYFWQVGQAGPMVNGYIAEHFRAGFRDNPRGVLRQYAMPHAPGNTDANFQRTCFTQLAHGATMLDFNGIGLNETFIDNHIDHRARSRFTALRDMTHCLGFVEDLLPDAKALASPVALLVSESTERWDFADVAKADGVRDLTGEAFRKVRLTNHQERVGLWTALTFLGVSPDLLIEEDLNEKILPQYRVLFVVGDTVPASIVPALEKWVREGGVLVATANAGRYDIYRQENKEFQTLLGLKSRTTEEKTTFLRPRLELPFLKPLGLIQGDGWEMPQLATKERMELDTAKAKVAFKDDMTPAIAERGLGKGAVVYVAALPGVAYLWSALQPPLVPDRGPNTHSIPTEFNPGTTAFLKRLLEDAKVKPMIEFEPSQRIDCRLLKSGKAYLLPMANYEGKVGHKLSLTIHVDGPISRVKSAYHGELENSKVAGGIRVTIPEFGYGDILRLES